MAALPVVHDDLFLVARPLPRARSAARGWRMWSSASRRDPQPDCPGSEVPARYFGYLRGGSLTC
jgi:hypothetical protein